MRIMLAHIVRSAEVNFRTSSVASFDFDLRLTKLLPVDDGMASRSDEEECGETPETLNPRHCPWTLKSITQSTQPISIQPSHENEHQLIAQAHKISKAAFSIIEWTRGRMDSMDNRASSRLAEAEK